MLLLTNSCLYKLSSFQATWHPLEDIIVVGRYPDKKFPGYVEKEEKSIDFFDPATGKKLCKLFQEGQGIASLNHFNRIGDTLASGMGE